jgi:hypothetical protein
LFDLGFNSTSMKNLSCILHILATTPNYCDEIFGGHGMARNTCTATADAELALNGMATTASTCVL